MLAAQRCVHLFSKEATFNQQLKSSSLILSNTMTLKKQFSLSPKCNINYKPLTTAKKMNILGDLKHLPSAPAPALCLGLSGLIPFVSAPLYMYNSGFFLPDVATAQLAYGASILSFLGGVRWGMLVAGAGDDLPPSWGQYTWSVTPSLISWTALLAPSATVGVPICVTGLLMAAAVDLKQPSYPPWFRSLRFILTLFAVISLIMSSFFSYSLGSKKQPSDYLS